MRIILSFVWVLAWSLSAVGGESGFAAKPVVAGAGNKVTITFTLSKPSDVEVAVLGAKGKVVRHLAAGVLGGKNPPPAPLKAGLAQGLVWDRKDNYGRLAKGGPFKVRVRAGMSVKFGRIFGTSPYTGDPMSEFTGLAVAPDGSLYVKMASQTGFSTTKPWQLRCFDTAGKYKKTLLPYPPSTEPDKAHGMGLVDAGDGLLTPRHRSGLYPLTVHFGENIYNRLVNGSVVFVQNRSAKLTFLKTDGSNAVKTVPMRTAKDKLMWSRWLQPQIAFSPDGKYAYYSNIAKTPYPKTGNPSRIDPRFPQGRVYRQDLTTPGSDPQKFYDLVLPDWNQEEYWLPTAHNRKTAAAGIDVDRNGHVFVCDLVNQEVVEVSPSGKKVSSTKVPWPDKVLINSKTGALYVLSCSVSQSHPKFRPNAAKLIKIMGRGAAAKTVATLRIKGIPPSSLALDESGETPSIWYGGEKKAMRVEDHGTNLVCTGVNLLNSDKDAISFVCYGDVDRETEQVYITSGTGQIWRYDGETGKGGRAPIGGVDLAIGPGGAIYVWSGWHGHIKRFTRDFKPFPLTTTGKHVYETFVEGRMGRGQSVPGMDVDHLGRTYTMIDRDGPSHVIVQDADGKVVPFERKALQKKGKPVAIPGADSIPVLIDGLQRSDSCVRLDPVGNIYVMRYGLAKDHVPIKGYEKEKSYLGASGTIYKFTPKGGEFKKDGPVDALRHYSVACGPISGRWASTGSCCTCARPRFDVDGFGRLYVPNGMTYKVTLLDNADNQILSFGGYGNWDAQGPNSSEPKPEIPLGWPVFAGASDKYVYVGDALNHRVVRADKQFASEVTLAVK